MAKGNSVKKETRIYKCADVDMFMTLLIILGYMSDNLVTINLDRPDILQVTIDDNIVEINAALVSDLGLNPKGDLRAQTHILKVIFRDAKKNLAFFKKQVDAQYEENPNHKDAILTDLGFNTYWDNITNGNVIAMIDLLYQFNSNMDANMIAELTGNGIQQVLITTITNYVNDLQAENISQENLKQAIQLVTQASVKKFNNIYQKNIKLIKICRAIFVKNNDPVRSKMFSFANTLSKLHHEHNPLPDEETTE